MVPGREASNYLSELRHIACPADDKIEVIKRAIENGTALEIIYLKPTDEKSRRVIKPEMVGEMEYCGKSYLGMRDNGGEQRLCRPGRPDGANRVQ